jgi:hypothetical protein
LNSLVKKIRQPTKKNDLQEEIEDEDKGKKTSGILNLDSLVKKIHQPTENNDFLEENEDNDEDKKLPSCRIGIRSSMILRKQMVLKFLSNIAK